MVKSRPYGDIMDRWSDLETSGTRLKSGSLCLDLTLPRIRQPNKVILANDVMPGISKRVRRFGSIRYTEFFLFTRTLREVDEC